MLYPEERRVEAFMQQAWDALDELVILLPVPAPAADHIVPASSTQNGAAALPDGMKGQRIA